MSCPDFLCSFAALPSAVFVSNPLSQRNPGASKPLRAVKFMKEDNDDFWKRSTRRAELEASRRESEQLHSRAWRRNVATLLLIMLVLGVLWLLRR